MPDRARVGDVEILAMVDVTPPPFPRERFFPDIPEEQWRPYREHLTAEGQFQTNFGFFALRSPSGIVLVDTGLGPGPHENFGGVRGALPGQLQARGVAPEEVQAVVITHLHLDHIGWNVTQEGASRRPTFPRARYYVPKGDWDYFTQPQVLEATPAVRASAVPLQELGVMELVEGDFAVTPEITTLSTPGHTPGHLSIVITSQGEKGVVLGDVFHSPAQVTEAEWCVGADMDKETARRSRRSLLDQAQREGFIIAAGHLLIDNNIGKVVQAEGRCYWQVLQG